MAEGLTDKQRKILECILRHTRECGYPPTVREIGDAVGLRSSSSVHFHLRRLEREGLISRDAVLTRAIRVVSDDPEPVEHGRAANLPLVGRVAAGSPLLAVEDVEDTFPVPEAFLEGGDGFVLRVRGDSMIDDGIRDGDYVIVRRQNTADNGDTVVALVDDEATVKRFYRERGRIRLQPANSSVQPIVRGEVGILGKVVGLVRRM